MIFIALGANLPSSVGMPRETLCAALDQFSNAGIRIVSVSPFYAAKAWPDPSDPPFVNAVALIETELSPSALMMKLHDIETLFGRKRSVKNAPRTLDLDLIDYEGHIEDGPPVLPHPRLRDRAFVLAPLRDIALDWRHPVSGETVGELLAALPGGGADVTRLD
jgi:2-amino-4-hydroxy-6-hydroxymethyldihydropteridine diphosphokinase